MKFCKGCQEAKPLADFSVAKRGKDGRAYYCRPCNAAKRREHYHTLDKKALADRQREYLRNNPEQAEKSRARARAWAKANPEKVNERNRAWRAANPERSASFTKTWRDAHPDETLTHRHRRMARLRNAPVNDFTAVDWREVLAEFNHACAYCLASDVPLQQEHMQPISRGGSHTRSNIVPACGPCNMRKGARGLLQSLAALDQRSA